MILFYPEYRDMNPILAELLHGAGLSDIISEPLQGGKVRTTKASGFVRRLMYENSLKHDGQYKYPVWKLHKDSEMDEPQKFVYKELANKQQNGDKDTAYGASPFIQKHFGTNRAVEFVRGRKHKKGDPKQESEAQREKRKDYPYRKKRKASKQQPQQSVEQQEERPAVVEEEDQPEVAEEPEDVAEDDQKYAEEHSADRTQREYDRMFQEKPASKAKESLRKKTAYQLKKEAKQAEEEAEERRRNPEPEISDALKEELRDFAENHPGRSPFSLGGIFSHDLTNAMVKREGLETPKDTPYRQSGEYKLSELIRKWYAYQQKYNNLIKPAPKGSIPVDESQASKQNFTAEQLEYMKYYGKDSLKSYDKVGEYAIPEGSSHIPSIVDAVLWSNNEVYKGKSPKLTRAQVIYYLQTKYGLK
jgi:chemotaxis protein histidine kinase CheA